MIVRPRFGVSTVEAYGWYDNEPRRAAAVECRRAAAACPRAGRSGPAACGTTSRPPVAAPPPDDRPDPAGAARRRRRLRGHVGVGIGGFRPVRAARRRAADGTRPGAPGLAVVATRTLTRPEYGRRLRPVLATRAVSEAGCHQAAGNPRHDDNEFAPRCVGAWPSGKARVFGSRIRRFESFRPNQILQSGYATDRLRRPEGVFGQRSPAARAARSASSWACRWGRPGCAAFRTRRSRSRSTRTSAAPMSSSSSRRARRSMST